VSLQKIGINPNYHNPKIPHHQDLNIMLVLTSDVYYTELTSNPGCCNEIPVYLFLLFGPRTNISGVNKNSGFCWLQLTLASTLHLK
jgi:hypothetical protein